MLYQLGALPFEVMPFNTHEADRETGYDFAAKDIVGAQRPREAMGEADEKRSFHCRLFPTRLGGLDELAVLDGMRASGEPQILVRGDGASLGWFFVEHVREHGEFLTGEGVPRVLEVTIELARSPAPASVAAMTSLLMSLFG